jgi:hypothetical protein
LSPAALATAIERAAARQPARVAVDTGGAERSARLIAELIGRDRRGNGSFVRNSGEGMLSA